MVDAELAYTHTHTHTHTHTNTRTHTTQDEWLFLARNRYIVIEVASLLRTSDHIRVVTKNVCEALLGIMRINENSIAMACFFACTATLVRCA